MLRLVHPPPGGNGTDPPKRRKCSRSASLVLTPDETQHFRASLKNIARAYGGAPVLALVMGVPVKTLYKVSNRRARPDGVLVIRLAKAGGVSVESILSGGINAAGRCNACGSPVATGRAS